MKSFTFIKTVLATVLLTVGVLGSAFGQTVRITGSVTEETETGRVPLIGATVLVKGNNTLGTSTDVNGKYTITVPPTATLTFSSLGYETQEVVVGNRNVIDIVMKFDSQVIEELVVVGYGVQKRSNVTGAISSVKAEEMKVYPTSSIAEMLRGRAAGVVVTAASGSPGSNPTIQIRGNRSMQGNTPLYIVDGVPSTAGDFGAINPEDVSNIEILKDAASKSIYGARGSDGVILVTTKRGEKNTTQVTYNGSFSVQRLWKNFDYYSPSEFYELRKEARRNYLGWGDIEPSISDVIDDSVMEEMYRNGEWTNWETESFRPATMQRHDVSFRGGSENIRVAASFGYLNQNGMLKTGSSLERGTGRINFDYQLYKWIRVGVNADFMKSEKENEAGTFNSFITRPPFGRARNEDVLPSLSTARAIKIRFTKLRRTSPRLSRTATK